MEAQSVAHTIQKRKKKHLLWMLASSLTLGALLAARLVPSLNDYLSGPSHYLNALASLMSQQIAERLHGVSPVIAVNDEGLQCSTIEKAPITDEYEDVVYVLTYSENLRSLCVTGYGILKAGSTSEQAVTLVPGMGRVYGRMFARPLLGVPLQRHVTVFSPAYLSRLHWRAAFDPSVAKAAVASQDFLNPTLDFSMEEFSLPFTAIRAEVAQRHETLNQVLDWLLGLFGAVLFFWCIRLMVLYYRARQIMHSYNASLAFLQFLAADVEGVHAVAKSRYFDERQERAADERHEYIFRRERREVQHRLESLVVGVPDEEKRLALKDALRRGNLEEMRAVLTQLDPQLSSRGPEERLHLLLESLREYCSREELEECRKEAFHVLEQSGFREARETVVLMHDCLRTRSKELERQQARQATSNNS